MVFPSETSRLSSPSLSLAWRVPAPGQTDAWEASCGQSSTPTSGIGGGCSDRTQLTWFANKETQLVSFSAFWFFSVALRVDSTEEGLFPVFFFCVWHGRVPLSLDCFSGKNAFPNLGQALPTSLSQGKPAAKPAPVYRPWLEPPDRPDSPAGLVERCNPHLLLVRLRLWASQPASKRQQALQALQAIFCQAQLIKRGQRWNPLNKSGTEPWKTGGLCRGQHPRSPGCA